MAAFKSNIDATQPRARLEHSLQNLFQDCVSNISEISKPAPAGVATQLDLISRRIEDSYLRLQIWGSDMGADSDNENNISINETLNSPDLVSPERVQDTLQTFRQHFDIIRESLQRLGKPEGKAAFETYVSTLMNL